MLSPFSKSRQLLRTHGYHNPPRPPLSPRMAPHSDGIVCRRGEARMRRISMLVSSGGCATNCIRRQCAGDRLEAVVWVPGERETSLCYMSAMHTA